MIVVLLFTIFIDVPVTPLFDDPIMSEKPLSVDVLKSRSQETAVKWKGENAIKVLIKYIIVAGS